MSTSCALQAKTEMTTGAPGMQILLRITPNMFREGFGAEAVTGAITRLMEVAGIDPEGEAPGSLDAVEVGWWRSAEMSPLATLKQLAKMCEDEKVTDAESGEVTVTAAKKIKALGVYDFSAECAAAAAALRCALLSGHDSQVPVALMRCKQVWQ
jgi:hypothetical protein